MRKILPVALAALLLALLIAQSSGAATVTHSVSVPLSTTDWSKVIYIPQFDPALGTLESVSMSMAAHVEGMAFFENMDAMPAEVTTYLSAELKLLNGELLAVAMPVHTIVDQVPGYDGVLDFGGESGKTYANLVADDDAAADFTDPAFLALFTGTGETDLTVAAWGKSRVTGAGNLAAGFQTKAQAEITITYTYSTCVSSIGGVIWLDSDGDGYFEPAIGELGINDVWVALYDANGNLVQTKVTADNPETGQAGWYLFDNLVPGCYNVIVAPKNFEKGGKQCTYAKSGYGANCHEPPTCIYVKPGILYGYRQTFDYDGVLDNQTSYCMPGCEEFVDANFGYRLKYPPCPESSCYWKHYYCKWPISEITIGGITYSKARAICLMYKSDCDKSYEMFEVLATAMLNVAKGCDSAPINDALYAAQEWMAEHAPGSKVSCYSQAWRTGWAIAYKLNKWNSGWYCGGCWD